MHARRSGARCVLRSEPEVQACEAQAARKDYLTQTEEAVRAVLEAFPDMNASQALVQVNGVSCGCL